MYSHCHSPVIRIHQPSHAFYVPLKLPIPGSAVMDGRVWPRGREGPSTAPFLLVVNCSECRSPRLKWCFCPFSISRVKFAMPSSYRKVGAGEYCHLCGFVSLVVVAVDLCHPLPAPLCLILSSASMCTGHSGQITVSTPQVGPDSSQVCWGHGECPTTVIIFALPSTWYPLFTLICPLLDFSIYGSLRCVCVLSRKFFVKL